MMIKGLVQRTQVLPSSGDSTTDFGGHRGFGIIGFLCSFVVAIQRMSRRVVIALCLFLSFALIGCGGGGGSGGPPANSSSPANTPPPSQQSDNSGTPSNTPSNTPANTPPPSQQSDNSGTPSNTPPPPPPPSQQPDSGQRQVTEPTAGPRDDSSTATPVDTDRTPSSACPAGTVPTHESLELGCITQQTFRQKIDAWSAVYRGKPWFVNQWGLGAVKADRAYAHLRLSKGNDAKPGAGVTIGFADSGIDEGHPHFADTKVVEERYGGVRNEAGNSYSHGTEVASVATGSRESDSKSFKGVAWGADVAMYAMKNYDLNSEVPTSNEYSRPRLGWVDDDYDRDRFARALAMNPDILNVSLATPGLIDHYSEEELRKGCGKGEAGSGYCDTIKVLAQEEAEEKTILVWSAGNHNMHQCYVEDVAGGLCVEGNYRPNVFYIPLPGETRTLGGINASSPLLWAGLTVYIEELRGHSVAVVATGKNGKILPISNRCGKAANWCIAAPGEDIPVAYFGPKNGQNGVREWRTGTGTSFAAPMVSGGLAIMKQLFRDQLSNTELVTRLFATANKTGEYAKRNIYGQGLMDLGAATSPWGVTAFRIPGQQTAGGIGGVGAAGTGIFPSSALGDGLAHALAGREVAAFDDLGAPFWYAADSFVQPHQSDITTSMRLDRLLAPPVSTRPEVGDRRLGIRLSRPAQDFGHLALATDANRFDLSLSDSWSVAYFNQPQKAEADQHLSGMTAEWRLTAWPMMAVQAGWLRERKSLLGSSASGAFGRLAGRTHFVSVGVETAGPLGWQVTTQGEWGVVRSDSSDGLLLRGLSGLRTDAYRVAARRDLSAGGSLQVALKQPVRVARGTADLDLPTGRTPDGRVASERVRVGMAPTGRQLDLSARIDHPLAGGSLALEGVLSRQPGHRAEAPMAWTVLMGWKTRF